MNLMSRHKLVVQEVATWIDVATWPVELGVATSFEVATWLVQSGGGEEMSRRPLGSRHGAGCLVQCTVLCTVQITVWTLFMDTVHEHCSQ